MKNKKIYATLTALLMFGTVSSVFAQGAGRGSGNNFGGLNSTSTENRVVNTISQRIENKYGRMVDKFQATIERLENIKMRINSRIVKMKSEGANTSSAEKAVADAEKYLADATASMINLQNAANLAKNIGDTASTTKEFKEARNNLLKTANATQKFLKQAHISLAKSIGALKGLKTGQNASTTPTGD